MGSFPETYGRESLNCNPVLNCGPFEFQFDSLVEF